MSAYIITLKFSHAEFAELSPTASKQLLQLARNQKINIFFIAQLPLQFYKSYIYTVMLSAVHSQEFCFLSLYIKGFCSYKYDIKCKVLLYLHSKVLQIQIGRAHV